jgi:hypothetical protein
MSAISTLLPGLNDPPALQRMLARAERRKKVRAFSLTLPLLLFLMLTFLGRSPRPYNMATGAAPFDALQVADLALPSQARGGWADNGTPKHARMLDFA